MGRVNVRTMALYRYRRPVVHLPPACSYRHCRIRRPWLGYLLSVSGLIFATTYYRRAEPLVAWGGARRVVRQRVLLGSVHRSHVAFALLGPGLFPLRP